MRFMIAPMKIGQHIESSLRFVKRQGVNVAALTEMDPGSTSLMPTVKRVFGRGFRVFSNSGGPHSEEIPLIKRRISGKVLSYRLFSISPNVGTDGAGNDRYLAELWVRHRRRVYAIFVIHTNAVIQNHDPRSPQYGDFLPNERWAVTKDAWDFTRRHIVDAKTRADAVVFMGDVNVLPVGEGLTDDHSPYVILRDLWFKVHNERVTLMATWGLKKSRPFRVFQPGHPGWGSDHAAILGSYRRPSRKH